MFFFIFAAVAIRAPQTDNTAVIVGGVAAAVIVLILLTVAMTIIVAVALSRNRTGQPARTAAQYVDICANTHYQCYSKNLCFLCTGVQWLYQLAKTRPMRL